MLHPTAFYMGKGWQIFPNTHTMKKATWEGRIVTVRHSYTFTRLRSQKLKIKFTN